MNGKVFIFIPVWHIILGICLWARIFLIYLDWLGSQEYATLGFGPTVYKFLIENFFHFSVVIVHQLGHNLGMSHLEEFCLCRKKHSIVNAYNTNTSTFSNCSHGSYFNLTNHRGGNLSDKYIGFSKCIPLEQCGNKVVENEEECDCGLEHQCRKDPCCGSNCKLKPWTACAFGPCLYKM